MPTDFLAGAKRVPEDQDVLAGATRSTDDAAMPQRVMQAPQSQPSWLDQAEEDLREGGGRTIVGRALGHMQGRGDQGFVGFGEGPNGAEAMPASPVMGLVHAFQGASEIPSHPGQGLVKTLGGIGEAASIPLAFAAGPESKSAAEAIPSTKYAGQLFREVEDAAKGVPVKLTRAMEPMERAQQLSARGHGTIGAIDNLYNRVNTINPLDYVEARDRASALSRLTGQDKMNATDTLRAQAKRLSHAFNEDIGDTAESVGKGDQYRQAMREYAAAARNKEIGQYIAKQVVPKAAAAVGAGAAYHYGREFLNKK